MPVALVSDPQRLLHRQLHRNDNDCPLPMKCAVDYDGGTKCLKRTVCDECKYDENCGYLSGNFQSDFTSCVPTSDGSGSALLLQELRGRPRTTAPARRRAPHWMQLPGGH